MCVECGNHCADEEVEATMKYDGSLGIAFLWENDLKVTTKRRMDSEQATWAKQWINQHCDITKFEFGHTYMFEIIYKCNTVIVNYPFDGLVLLAVTDDIYGREFSFEELLRCAQQVGFFMVPPRFKGTYDEILWYCGGIDLGAHDSKRISSATHNTKHSGDVNASSCTASILHGSATLSRATLSGKAKSVHQEEGWVVKFIDGSRQKIVHNWWKEAFRLAQLAHPQIVWLLLKQNKFKNIFNDMPPHIRKESQRMLRAIGRKFMKIVVEILGSKFEPEWDFDPLEIIVYPETLTSLSWHLLSLQNSLEKQISPISGKLNQDKRLPILNYIRPVAPILDDYVPSDNFSQTWCKGWKTLPIDNERFIQEVLQKNHCCPPLLLFPVELILHVLEFLDGVSLAKMCQVCVMMLHIVNSSAVLKRKIATAKENFKTAKLDEFWEKFRKKRDWSPEIDSLYGSSWRYGSP